jgi:hypothetical protein
LPFFTLRTCRVGWRAHSTLRPFQVRDLARPEPMPIGDHMSVASRWPWQPFLAALSNFSDLAGRQIFALAASTLLARLVRRAESRGSDSAGEHGRYRSARRQPRQSSYVRLYSGTFATQGAVGLALHGCTQTADEYDHGTGWLSSPTSSASWSSIPAAARQQSEELFFMVLARRHWTRSRRGAFDQGDGRARRCDICC